MATSDTSPPHLPYQRRAHMEERAFWEDAKGPFSMWCLDGFYLANTVPNLQSGFSVEYILLPAGKAGVSKTASLAFNRRRKQKICVRLKLERWETWWNGSILELPLCQFERMYRDGDLSSLSPCTPDKLLANSFGNKNSQRGGFQLSVHPGDKSQRSLSLKRDDYYGRI